MKNFLFSLVLVFAASFELQGYHFFGRRAASAEAELFVMTLRVVTYTDGGEEHGLITLGKFPVVRIGHLNE